MVQNFHSSQNGEPSLQFLQKFGSTLQRALIDLPALTPEDLISQISNTANSSPSLDRCTRNELHSLSLWCPTMFQHLCTLLNQIENGMPWPDLLTIGAVSFIPKDVEGGIATPLQHRPITVLSAVLPAMVSNAPQTTNDSMATGLATSSYIWCQK